MEYDLCFIHGHLITLLIHTRTKTVSEQPWVTLMATAGVVLGLMFLLCPPPHSYVEMLITNGVVLIKEGGSDFRE